MIDPAEVFDAANAKAEENAAFRAFLKAHADGDELDRHFHQLHEELFAGYDCCGCNNCCSIYAVAVREDEAEAIAGFLGMRTQAFAERYLFKLTTGGYGIESPCPFLLPDGKCLVHECKPAVCRNYPNTNKPDRLSNLLHMVSIAEECPVVYEMMERLKAIYHFSIR
ncbi:MAG: YkgJ family cysteine cluster protein [Clostridiales bacterium]|nr:YkgJ family cysteine cluster protein [Clostridiales bacterium]